MTPRRGAVSVAGSAGSGSGPTVALAFTGPRRRCAGLQARTAAGRLPPAHRYTPSTTPGQVIRMGVPSGGPVYGYNILAWLLDRPAERYTATYVRSDRLNGRPVDVVRLDPAVPDLPFERAIVWLDKEDGLPRRLEITEHSGATRTLTLSKVRANRSVPENTFVFKVPSGVRVVDQ